MEPEPITTRQRSRSEEPAPGDAKQTTHGEHTTEPLVKLVQVGKVYPLSGSRAGKLTSLWRTLRGQPPSEGEGFRALHDINLRILPGASTALIGVNGAGKSTLLKLIAGVAKPTTGTLQVSGRVGALLELGAGFHPEYTGRENIAIGCALMGLNPSETRLRTDDIIEFADIGPHIDQPIKHYSSGMVVRLGFAVATAQSPDLLITDEVLSVGDESFQRKCVAWLERYLSNRGTLLLCSHSMYHVQKLCQQTAWIENGHVRRLGDTAEVVREYLAWHEERTAQARKLDPRTAVASTGYAVVSMSLNGLQEHQIPLIPEGGELRVDGELHSPDGRRPHVAVGIVRADGTPVAGCYSEMDGFALHRIDDHRFRYAIRLPRLPLLPGRYVARSHAMDPEGMRMFDHVEMRFDVVGTSRETGFVKLEHEWE